MKLTEKMFQLSTPYNNPFQGSALRLLFVCSAGLLRSPTCADVGTSLGFNTRSCGSHMEYALIPLSVNLIMWANKIIFVNPDNYSRAIRVFEPTGYDADIKHKSIVWDIEDDFNRGDPGLVKLVREKLLSLS